MFSTLADEAVPAASSTAKAITDTNKNNNERTVRPKNEDLHVQADSNFSRLHGSNRNDDNHDDRRSMKKTPGNDQDYSSSTRALPSSRPSRPPVEIVQYIEPSASATEAVPSYIEFPSTGNQCRRSSSGVKSSPSDSLLRGASKGFLFEQLSKSLPDVLTSSLESETKAPHVSTTGQHPRQQRRPTIAIASISSKRRSLVQGHSPHPPTGSDDGKSSSAINLHTMHQSTETENKDLVTPRNTPSARPNGPRRGSVDTTGTGSCSESSLSATWWPSLRRASSRTGSASLHFSSRRGSMDSSTNNIGGQQQIWHSSEVVNSKVMREAKMVIEDGDMLRDFQAELKGNGTTTGMATKAQLQEFLAKRAAAAENNTLTSNKSDRPSRRRSILHNKSALCELLPTLKEDDSSETSSDSDGPTWIDQVNKRAKELKALIKKQGGEEGKGAEVEEEAQKKSERQRGAEIALVLARLYADIGLTKRSVAVIDEALALWTFGDRSSINYKELVGGFTQEEVEAFHEKDLHSIIQLKIEQSKVLATQAANENGSHEHAKCIMDALAIFQHFSSTVDVSRYRSVKFPIYSVLFLYIKTGSIQQENRQYFMTQLSEDFVTDATLHGDPVHLSRALAMRAEVCSNFGRLEEAINSVETLRCVYDPKFSNQISKAYGSDRSAQCFSLMALWLMEANDPEGSLRACEYVLTEILPKSDPKNVHNSMCLLYPIIIIFKNLGVEATVRVKKLFQIHVLDAFHEHFKDGGITPTLSVFKPLSLLLSICADKEEFGWRSDLSSIFHWAASEDGGIIPEFIDSAFENFGLSPTTITAELCLRLSELGEVPLDIQDRLLVKSKALALQAKEKLRGRGKSILHRIAYNENERVCEELDFQSFKASAQNPLLPGAGGEEDGAMKYWLQRYMFYRDRKASPRSNRSSSQSGSDDPSEEEGFPDRHYEGVQPRAA